jgi:hypothetical protein
MAFSYQFSDSTKQMLKSIEAAQSSLSIGNFAKAIQSAQLSDSARQMLKSIEAAQSSLSIGNFAKAIQSAQLSDSARQMLKSIEAAQSSLSIGNFAKAIQSAQLSDSTRQMLKSIEATQSSLSIGNFAKAIQSAQLSDSTRQMLKSIEAAQSSLSIGNFAKAIQSAQLNDATSKMLGSIRAHSILASELSSREVPQTLGFENILKALSKQAWPLAYAPLDSDLVINADNTVTLNASTLSYQEIVNAANEIANKAHVRQSERLDQAITKLVTEIRALQNPVLERILTVLIFPIIVAFIFSFINPIADFYIKENLGAQKRELEKQIRKHVLSSSENFVQIDSYRLVTRSSLDVQAKPSAKSPTLGRVYWGNVVLLIEKRGDWSLVAWADDENDVAIQGWVYSRYLKKFR